MCGHGLAARKGHDHAASIRVVPTNHTHDLDQLPPKRGMLTTGNPKTAKGEGHGYYTAILHLAPSTVSGRQTCANATPGCAAACLNTAGHGGIALDENGLNGVQVARIRRTRWFFSDRPAFMDALCRAIVAHERAAARHGLTPVVRLNGTSDIRWENIPLDWNGVRYPHIFAAFAHLTFYDYTKHPARKRAKVASIPNYSLTFSLAESNAQNAADALESGVNVAAVFSTRKGADLPAWFTINGVIARVIDGDATDLRFLDPRESRGIIVGLRAKGRARKDTSGFVQQV